jgi:preprotein translocase subunit YajC
VLAAVIFVVLGAWFAIMGWVFFVIWRRKRRRARETQVRP